MMVISGGGVKVITIAGQEIFADHKFGWHEALTSHAIVSPDARRFGVAATVERMPFLSDFFIDVASRLLIYDVASHSRVYSLPLDHPLALGDLWNNQQACLSPDGSLLAYAAHSNLRIYALPAEVASQTP